MSTSEISDSPLLSILSDQPAGEEEADANFVDLTPAGVREYVYLTRSAVEVAPPAQEAALPFEPQIVAIPAGPFWMGTPEGEVDELHRLLQQENKNATQAWVENETPQHEVTLPAYALSRYPVTNAEYRRFIEEGGYTTRAATIKKAGRDRPRRWASTRRATAPTG